MPNQESSISTVALTALAALTLAAAMGAVLLTRTSSSAVSAIDDARTTSETGQADAAGDSVGVDPTPGSVDGPESDDTGLDDPETSDLCVLLPELDASELSITIENGRAVIIIDGKTYDPAELAACLPGDLVLPGLGDVDDLELPPEFDQFFGDGLDLEQFFRDGYPVPGDPTLPDGFALPDGFVLPDDFTLPGEFGDGSLPPLPCLDDFVLPPEFDELFDGTGLTDLFPQDCDLAEN